MSRKRKPYVIEPLDVPEADAVYRKLLGVDAAEMGKLDTKKLRESYVREAEEMREMEIIYQHLVGAGVRYAAQCARCGALDWVSAGEEKNLPPSFEHRPFCPEDARPDAFPLPLC